MGIAENTGNLAFIVGPGAVRKYVSYLCTEELAASAGVAEQKLRGRLSTHQREVWQLIHSDIREELARRQLSLLGEREDVSRCAEVHAIRPGAGKD